MKQIDDSVYHELGHFLAFIAGNADKTASFQSIFAAEKANVTAFNKAYVTQNASEYFAESVKDYILNLSLIHILDEAENWNNVHLCPLM